MLSEPAAVAISLVYGVMRGNGSGTIFLIGMDLKCLLAYQPEQKGEPERDQQTSAKRKIET